ncbi:3-ketoacyl-ACP reductase [Kiloniella litopenaei]|uniref:3-ketoacyl-ACP reductase n=1 Tax=Kiloniella litopenaei TaxID=1549748 RepID=A0A0M2R6W8_9PROT|nr:SDR family oxidoreductase [Kiloniella litopenaei]KKJ75745.1 3-ketoacyl-ACP reductase [Kiloniella litopenaei]
MDLNLRGYRVLVTAGAAGLGRATAEAFLREGAKVHVCDIDSKALDDFSFQGDTQKSGELTKSLLDVTDEKAVKALFSDLEANFNGLDVLVNNAGTAGPTGELETLDYTAWRKCISVNIDSQFLFSKQAIPLMKKQKSGAIFNLSSTAGLFGFPNRAPYAAAKWAVIGITKTMAMELGPYGIRVNAVAPGSVSGSRMDRVIESSALAQDISPELVREQFEKQTSMRTFVLPEDIANTILFAASPKGSKISGQVLTVDGHTEGLSIS